MLSRAMFRCGRRVFAVEFDSEPLYFTLTAKPHTLRHDYQRFFGDGTLFSLYIDDDDRIHKAQTHAEIQRKVFATFARHCDVLETCSFIPDVKNSVVKGFCIRDKSTSALSEEMMKTFEQKESVRVFSYKHEGPYCWQEELWSPVNQTELEERRYVTPASAPLHHPSTLAISSSDVFYDMNEAYKVLQEVDYKSPSSFSYASFDLLFPICVL